MTSESLICKILYFYLALIVDSYETTALEKDVFCTFLYVERVSIYLSTFWHAFAFEIIEKYYLESSLHQEDV